MADRGKENDNTKRKGIMASTDISRFEKPRDIKWVYKISISKYVLKGIVLIVSIKHSMVDGILFGNLDVAKFLIKRHLKSSETIMTHFFPYIDYKAKCLIIVFKKVLHFLEHFLTKLFNLKSLVRSALIAFLPV